MASLIEQCALCLHVKELRHSHLLPAGVWRLSRDPSRRVDPNPVVVKTGKAFTTSRQVSASLLCGDCENRFSKNGERYVLSQCARPNGQFLLREALEIATSVIQDGELRVYDASAVLGSAREQYLYFAASVFWRASVRSWSFGGQRLQALNFGAACQEEFRQYLYGGDSGFPSKARLFVHVSSDPRIDMTSVFPCAFRMESAWRYKFYIPGILFILFLGADVPEKYDALALNGEAGSFIWLCPWENDSLFRGFDKRMRQAVRSHGLARRGGRMAG